MGMNNPGIETKPSNTNSKHDIYTDPAIAKMNMDDPLVKWFMANWRKGSVVIIAALVLAYFVNAYRESYESSMRGAADVYVGLESAYKEYLTAVSANEKIDKDIVGNPSDKEANDKKSADSLKKLNEAKSHLTQLINSTAGTRDPYKSIAELYRALMARVESPGTVNSPALEQFRNWKSIGSAGSRERFYGELGALILARGLVDDEAKRADGEQLLKELSKDGVFANVSAALSLAYLADSKERMSEALANLEAINQSTSGQSDLLNDEIKRLNASIGAM